MLPQRLSRACSDLSDNPALLGLSLAFFGKNKSKAYCENNPEGKDGNQLRTEAWVSPLACSLLGFHGLLLPYLFRKKRLFVLICHLLGNTKRWQIGFNKVEIKGNLNFSAACCVRYRNLLFLSASMAAKYRNLLFLSASMAAPGLCVKLKSDPLCCIGCNNRIWQ